MFDSLADIREPVFGPTVSDAVAERMEIKDVYGEPLPA